MRPNNREKILDAAVRVAERDGARRLTLEATAEEAGLTRGGMMYHFRDRDALSLAMQEHLARRWEARLIEAAGKPAAEATPIERVRAYVTVATTSATAGELDLIHDTGHDAALHEPWARVLSEWTPSPHDATDDATTMRLFIACLAADGLWSYDSLGARDLPAATRRALAQHIIDLAGPPDAST
ncbi:TetR/AcrR family transcriptional regulator [Prescottella defluvii]|uniref:TetR/AcrR family transcriptional regulator n=1 Tax=Prescottella defluvii TaxID=1323361 RepID=UPI0004F26ABC|nr:TetR/AcrR family transcriptional regulator [Prescottella defluvii]